MYSSSTSLRKKSDVGSEPFLYDTHTNLQALPRQQNHLLREFSTNEKQRSAPASTISDHKPALNHFS